MFLTFYLEIAKWFYYSKIRLCKHPRPVMNSLFEESAKMLYKCFKNILSLDSWIQSTTVLKL